MRTGRQFLIEKFKKLMERSPYSTPGAIHKTFGISRASLDNILKGRKNFTIDRYEKLVSRVFKLTFEQVVAGQRDPKLSEGVEDIYEALDTAIANAKETGSLAALRYALDGIVQKTIHDRSLLHEPVRGSPPPEQREEGGMAARGGRKTAMKRRAS